MSIPTDDGATPYPAPHVVPQYATRYETQPVTEPVTQHPADRLTEAVAGGPEAHFVGRHDPFLPVPTVVPASWGEEDLTALFGLPDESSWQERALCAQTDPEAFFPEKGGSTREAKRVCTGCEVKAECLEYALDNDERFGIWGGMSERERRRLKRRAI